MLGNLWIWAVQHADKVPSRAVASKTVKGSCLAKVITMHRVKANVLC